MKIYFLMPMLLALSLLVSGCFNKNIINNNINETASANVNQEQNIPEEAATFTMEEIAKHNNRDDCWLLISDKVYDVTSFIASGNHGGGDAILAGCGIDATELYETRPMGSDTPHSDKARSFLPNFYIGDLKP